MAYNNTKSVTGTSQAKIDTNPTVYTNDSVSIANVHATASVTVDLWVTDTTGTDISATGVLVNNAAGYPIKTTSTIIAVDGTSATVDLFLGEKIFNSDGTFIGTCTAVGGTTAMTFGSGLDYGLIDNNNLHTGNRYYILNNVVIPNGATLKLESNEFNFDKSLYSLWIQLVAGTSTRAVDVITRHAK